jgi:AcrR family transcriptional regulator
MDRRAASAEATRLRVLEAAVRLHAEKGAAATTWLDIARRADVALGTVYRYFPGYDELIPACTTHGARLTRPPTAEMMSAGRTPKERLTRFVHELFAYYERAAPWLEHGRCDRKKLAILEAILRRRETAMEEVARQVLGASGQSPEAVAATLALTDLSVWRSLTSRQMTTAMAADLATAILTRWLFDGDGDSSGSKEIP